MSKRVRSLFIFKNKKREQLFVSKNSNFQTLVKKDWWPDVQYIDVQHFNSLDDLENALAIAKSNGTKWNQITTADAIAANHDIFKDGFPVE